MLLSIFTRFRPHRFLSIGLAALSVVGCGTRTDSENARLVETTSAAVGTAPLDGVDGDAPPAPQQAPAPNQTPAPKQSPASSATESVAQFLDAVRRGGDTLPAEQWLTAAARREMTSAGQRLTPPGSPGARYEITRAESVPDEPGSALVHSYWIERSEDGRELDRYEVVWAVRHERGAWRIRGLAVQPPEDAEPIVVNLEDPESVRGLEG